MSGYISAALVRRVRERAKNICEYCRLPQDSQEATFHVDHIQPRSAGGLTSFDNLALACVTCSLRKAARAMVRD
jgi:5-methylcytosine-specific restriction endonuclease McrA